MNLLTAAPDMGGCLFSTAYVLHFIDRVMQILILKPQMTLIIHCNRTIMAAILLLLRLVE